MSTTTAPAGTLQEQYAALADQGKIGQDEHGTWRWYWTAPDGSRKLTSGVIVDPATGKLVRYKRMTSFNKVISDKTALDAWNMRKVIQAVAMAPDLIAALRTASTDQDVNSVIEKARQRSGSDASATLGSAIHAATHALLKGEQVPDLGEYQPDVDAYLKAMEPFMVVDAEQFGVSDQYRICGSWDRTLQIKRSGRPPFRADLKTGSVNREYLDEIAMQLAGYTIMTAYDQATGQRHEPIELDTTRALVIHVPAGQAKADLIWLPLEKAMRTLLPLAQRIHEARKGQTKGYAFDLAQEVDVPAVDDTDPIEAAIAAVTGDPEQAKTQLREIWAANKDAWTDPEKAKHYKALGDQRLADLARDVIVRAGIAA